LIDRHRSETPLAFLTLSLAVLHFTLETWYHLTWGQPLQALIVDYISVALMVSGALGSLRLRPASAAGLLAAAWAYALGFAWRSVFGRIELLEAGKRSANDEAGFVLPVLVTALIVVAFIFLWALWLTWRQTLSSRNTRGARGR
jgi:hypothetical protein